jgi:hypothetical protein
VPPDYVTRLVDELIDHRQDLLAELVSNGADARSAQAEADHRMGSPGMIADAAMAGLRIGTFTGRHNLFIFAVAPLLLLALGWGTCLSAAAWFAEVASGTPGAASSNARAILLGGCYLAGYALHAILASVFYLHARRRCCQTVWAWVPGVLLSVIASYSFFQVGFSSDSRGAGSLVAGIAVSPSPFKLGLAFSALAMLELRHCWQVRQRVRAISS